MSWVPQGLQGLDLGETQAQQVCLIQACLVGVAHPSRGGEQGL